MLHVVIALLPTVGVSLFFFGLPALRLIAVTLIASCGTEWVINRCLQHRPNTLGDGSAAVTGLLLALTLPAQLPWWTAAIGAVVAIGVGKMAFGGLGCNIFNPALVGRVFLLLSFPALMTTWPAPGWGFCAEADGITTATWLSHAAQGITSVTAAHAASPIDMLIGFRAGSMGEAGIIAIAVGCIYLIATRIISYIIPVTIIAAYAAIAYAMGYDALTEVMAGGLVFGAVFMATDYVTSPMTAKGMIVYGLIIGLLTLVIRHSGSYPEGISFAILLGNGVTPLIDRYMRPARFSNKATKHTT